MRALLVTDLEGVHGADSVECLVGGEPAWERARLRATHEVNLAIAALSRQGFTSFVVSDSHHNGTDAPNLVLEALDQRATCERRSDAFAPALFNGADAVAALGMHAAGGAPGFISHALDVGLAWELEGRLVSETDFLLDLCAAAMTPFLFVTGDDVLASSLPSIRAVVTKRAVSVTSAASLPLETVEDGLVRAALEPGRAAPSLPPGPLRLHVKSPSFEIPALPFVERESDFTVLVHGESPRSRYANALATVELVSAASEDFLTGEPGEPGFVEQVSAFLRAPWPSLKVS
ncbi:MAG: M55 family metallopeptidase [Myxococcaceae bacterium]|nr:M55 family metallopeptidase [Myxococcaceae bacterium]